MWRGSLNVCQINCRSIATENRRVEFEEALMKIRFDVVGLSETWIAGSGQDLFRKSGCMLYYSGGQHKRRGVGFIVAPHLIKNVYRFTPINDRCCTLEIRTDRFTVCLVMGYAPTSDADDRDYESFLRCLQRACNQFCGPTTRFGLQNWTGRRSKGMDQVNSGQTEPPRKSRRCTILLGDFNASVGRRAHPQEPAVGPYGYGIRNHRGEQLVSYCSLNGWKVANSYCKQRGGRKWTWRAPNGVTLKELDLFLIRRHDVVRSVSVVNQFDFRSDHRLCRLVLDIEGCLPRRRPQAQTTKLNWPLFRHTVHELKDDLVKADDHSTQYLDICEVLQHARAVATEKNPQAERLSTKSRNLFADRRKLLAKGDPLSRIQLVQVNKALRISISSDLEKRRLLRYYQTLASKKLFEKVTTHVMRQVLKNDGSPTTTPQELKARIQEFFNKLYEKSVAVQPTTRPPSAYVPSILEDEVRKQLCHMKKRTAPGHDSITTMMLRCVEDDIVPALAQLFTRMLESSEIPPGFADSVTTLIPKNGDLTDLANYRPISVLPAPYKLFTRVILARIHEWLESNQPVEQAGFRRNFSTVEHLHTIQQLIDKANDYGNDIYLVFVDFRKAYDTIEWDAVWNSLLRHGVPPLYVEILQKVYDQAGSKIKVQEELVEVLIQRGVRQGCVLSPLLFNAVLEDIFRQVHWERLGIKIDGRRLSNLRYADDVVLIGRSLQAVQRMVTDLEVASRRVGLEVNRSKTVAMTNSDEGNLLISGTPVTFVRHFRYLGCSVTCTDDDQEISRRIAAGWAAFNRHRLFLSQRTVPMKMKHRVFLTCVVPSLLYGCEVWRLRKSDRCKLQSVQRRMERAMLGLSLLDRVRNEEVRRRTALPDIADLAWRRKINWALKIAQMDPSRWSTATTIWHPRRRKRRPGRPPIRWDTDIRKANETVNGPRSPWYRHARSDGKRWLLDMWAARST